MLLAAEDESLTAPEWRPFQGLHLILGRSVLSGLPKQSNKHPSAKIIPPTRIPTSTYILYARITHDAFPNPGTRLPAGDTEVGYPDEGSEVREEEVTNRKAGM